MDNNNVGIYSIRNLVNGKEYIGKTSNISSRFSHHKAQLENNSHPNIYLQNSWNKYGENNFEFLILENCERDDAKLKELEIYYIRNHNSFRGVGDSGYNLTRGGEGTLGRIVTEKTKLKISKSVKGKTLGRKDSKETVEKKSIRMSGSKNPMFGISPSKETRRKISEALSGENHYGYGKHRSDETKVKISKSLTGKIKSEEARRKLSETNSGGGNGFFGKIHNEESRRKISEAGRNRKPISEETRKKMSESHKKVQEEKRKGGKDGLDSL